jgi:hypothetical protein
VNRSLFLVLFANIFFTGCALGPMPQNAKEFREGMKGGGFGINVEEYVVKHPYSKVSKILAAKTKQCLYVERTESACNNHGCTYTNITYNPKITRGKKHTELLVQIERDPDNAWYIAGKPPKGGAITVLVDLVPAGRSKTKVNVYSPSMAYTSIAKAVKHWTKGTNLGCPTFE